MNAGIVSQHVVDIPFTALKRIENPSRLGFFSMFSFRLWNGVFMDDNDEKSLLSPLTMLDAGSDTVPGCLRGSTLVWLYIYSSIPVTFCVTRTPGQP